MTALSIPPAIILAAGRGNRLLPLTAERPKCLLEVGERSILEHQIRALTLSGVAAIQVVTGHGADRVRQTCDGLAEYAHNEAFDTTNSFDSLGCSTLEVGEGGLVIMNSDVLFHPDLLKRLLAEERENVLLADYDSAMGEEEMKIVVGEGGRIERISKDIDPKSAHAENLGVLRLGRAAARRMLELSRSRDRGTALCWVPDAIDRLRTEFDFFALGVDGLPWIEIDYLHDLQRARREVYPRVEAALWGAAS